MTKTQPVDFDRLFLKATANQPHLPTYVSAPTVDLSPLDLVQSLTSQFRSHFQEVKASLSQKVEQSAREMAQYEEIKKEINKEKENQRLQHAREHPNVPSIPVQIYDWKEQKLKASVSPRRKKEDVQYSPHLTPTAIENPSPSQKIPKRSPSNKKGTKEMEKFLYNKRFEKYLEQKYYGRSPLILNQGDDRLRYIREEGNILDSHQKEEEGPMDDKLREMEKYFLSEKPTGEGKGELLQFVKKYEYEYRKQAYKHMKEAGEGEQDSVAKSLVVRYLFDHSIMMMLYSVDPFKLVEELASFPTSTPNQLSFVQLSNFLLAPRQPPVPESYQQASLLRAQEETFKDGVVVEPIIPYTTWLGEDDAVEQIFKCFQHVDVFGRRKVPTEDLIIRLKKYAMERDLLRKEPFEITAITKPISIHRLIYEIEFEHPRRKEWTLASFKEFFQEYTKLPTLPREQIIQNEMVEGNLECTLLLNTSILLLLRQVFNNCPKYCGHYVDKLEYLDGVYESQGFEKVRNCEVRRAPYNDINMETVEETLARIYYEGDEFLEMDEIVDFFTNKGRPYIVNERCKAKNTEMQMQKIDAEDLQRENNNTKDSEDEDIEYSILRQQKKVKEFKTRQQKVIEIKQKMKSITVPVPFALKEKIGETIRQRKVKEMLEEKEMKIQEDMKPITVAKEVPWFVKQNLYQRLMEEQDSLRRRRLEAHKSYLETLMRPPAESLMKKLPRGQSVEEGEESMKTKYQFVARTMPWYCEIELLDRIVRDKLERKERIRLEIEEREQEDGTPQGVKNMMQRQVALKEKWALRNDEKGRRSKTESKPYVIKRKEVPDFQKIFKENGIELELGYVRPKHVEPHIETWEEHRKKPQADSKEEVPLIKSTKKFDALVELRQKQKLVGLAKKQQEKEDDMDRKMARQRMAPKVRKVLKRMELEHQRDLAELGGGNNIKKEFEERQREYVEQIYKAYERLNEEPLMIEKLEEEKRDRLKEKAEMLEKAAEKRPLREKPVRKALHRTDDRKKNLEQQHKQKEKVERRGMDQYYEQEDEEDEDDGMADNEESERYKQQMRNVLQNEVLKGKSKMEMFQGGYDDDEVEGEDQENGEYYYEEEEQYSDRHDVGNRSF